ncbi:MAG: hypothetical protein KJ062_12895, partial [Thermoanaerobaculia bacterium]|nr:hypothetical protein [Thermoanaerobaculia bacterium]
MKRLDVPVLALALLLALSAGCRPTNPQSHSGRDDHDHEGEAAETAEGEEGLAVPLDGIRGLRLVEALARRAEGAWFPGEAIGDENAQGVLAAPVGGIVVAPPAAPRAPGPPAPPRGRRHHPPQAAPP